MAMDGLMEAGSGLDLNIVAIPASSPQKAVKQKAKKRNKYEKRRQRSQRAKEINETKAAGSNSTQAELAGSSKATATATSAVQAGKYGPTGSSPTNDNENVGSDHDESDGSENRPSQDDKVKVKVVPAEQSDETKVDADDDIAAQTTEKEDKDSQDDAQVDTATNSTSTNEKQRNTLPDDAQERAKYLAEFHARPNELDRRAGSHVVRKVTGKDSTHLFTEATEWDKSPLHSRIVTAIQSNSFNLQRPTVIQSKAIPAFFQDDQLHNVLLQSETGSGKTLAYLLPILQAMGVDKQGELIKCNRLQTGTRCIILCPTRELAAQTFTVCEKLCNSSFNWLVPGCLLGEENRKSEKARIRKGLAIIVATPGRLLDHLTRTESLLMALKGKLEWLVLDEADRLLDLGLGPQVAQIIQRIRSNQPGSGRDGITWRSALVSATVTTAVEKLAKETLLGGNNKWKWVKGGNHTDEGDTVKANTTEREYADSTPRQLTQLHMTVSAKLRLSALVAFLVQRIEKNERTVVFMSTCAGVDYHHALFEALGSILDDDDDTNTANGIFGSKCPIYRLHGSVPHGERQQVLKRFMKDVKQSAVLLATDVAARGLNLHDVDWIVQYDPPGEVADYVHRAGRAARAGRAGHSLLFLLPSEHAFLDILKKRGVKAMSAFSLASTLNAAATACSNLTEEGIGRSGGGLGQARGANSRSGEAFSSEIQRRMEDAVVQDEARVKAANKEAAKKARKTGMKTTEVTRGLSDLARNAFLSHIRAYPTKEKLVKHIFPAKALHLGHVARSFALKEPPKKLGTRTQKPASAEADESRKRNKSMAFEVLGEEPEDAAKRAKQMRNPDSQPQKGKRAELFENAAKLQRHGLESL